MFLSWTLSDLGIMNIDYDIWFTCQTDKSEKLVNELTLEFCDTFYSFEGDILSLRIKHIMLSQGIRKMW